MSSTTVPSVGLGRMTEATRTPSGGYETVARARDVVISAVVLVLLSPLLALMGLLVRLSSRGPVIFRQIRVGRDGEHFTLYKFRTMRVDAPDTPHRALVSQLITARDRSEEAEAGTLVLDDRVTRVGRYLRRHSLDELPQLVNVLRNEMSLVGPRPGLPYEVELYDDEVRERLAVKPGLTGLWQVSGRKGLGMREMFELDRQYVRSRSLRTDCGILARTLRAVVRPSGSW